MSDETKHTVHLLPQVDDAVPRPKETIAALEPIGERPSSTLDLDDDVEPPPDAGASRRPRRIHRRGVAAVLNVPTLDLEREAFEAARPGAAPVTQARGGQWLWLLGLVALAGVLTVVLLVLYRRG